MPGPENQTAETECIEAVKVTEESGNSGTDLLGANLEVLLSPKAPALIKIGELSEGGRGTRSMEHSQL